jgi:hypothetical protein
MLPAGGGLLDAPGVMEHTWSDLAVVNVALHVTPRTRTLVLVSAFRKACSAAHRRSGANLVEDAFRDPPRGRAARSRTFSGRDRA